jgi:hypothetical protein
VCRLAGDPLVVTIANEDISGGGQWVCQPLHTTVDIAKWTYYVSRTLRFIESSGLEVP